MAPDVEVAPLRSMDDFLLSSARFQVPDLKDPERTMNRIINNLLYYQTNYFLVAVVMFLLVGIQHPAQMMLGIFAVIGAFVAFVKLSENQAPLRRFKRQHPAACMILIIVVGYFVVHLLGSVLVFLFGIAVPMLAIIIHSSLRLRNLKSKVMNKVEFVGIKRSPMGVFLEAVGFEQEVAS